MLRYFSHNSEEYRKNAVGLAKIESIYFPSMGLMIGLSTLMAIMIGGIYVIYGRHNTDLGTITEICHLYHHADLSGQRHRLGRQHGPARLRLAETTE